MVQQIKADKDYTLAILIMRVADMLVKVRERELLPQNLSAIAAEILFLVDAMGQDVTPAKITRMLMREAHSISTILIRMETHGLIKRTKDMEYKNYIRITMTAKGKNTLEQAMKQTSTTQLLANLTAEQRSKLRQSLNILKKAGLRELNIGPRVLLWP